MYVKKLNCNHKTYREQLCNLELTRMYYVFIVQIWLFIFFWYFRDFKMYKNQFYLFRLLTITNGWWKYRSKLERVCFLYSRPFKVLDKSCTSNMVLNMLKPTFVSFCKPFTKFISKTFQRASVTYCFQNNSSWIFPNNNICTGMIIKVIFIVMFSCRPTSGVNSWIIIGVF